MNKTIRCLSWCAVSSEPQTEGDSIPDQQRQNKYLIDNLGDRYPGYEGVMVDEIVIAASRSITLFSDACERIEGYARLRELVTGRGIDVIVCRSIDRIGRRESLVSAIRQLCVDYDIVIVPRDSLPQSLDASLMRSNDGAMIVSSIQGTMAEIEIRKLVRRRAVGMVRRVRDGHFPSRLPFGYMYEHDKDGTRRVIHDPRAAPIIRRALLDLFVGEGLGMIRIARQLNSEGYTSPTGRAFDKNLVYAMLKTLDAYGGTVTYRSSNGNVSGQGAFEPIFSPAEMERIRGTWEDRQQRGRGYRRRVFTGILFCGSCGRQMKGTVLKRYQRVNGPPNQSSTQDGYVCGYADCPAGVNVAEYLIVEALQEAIVHLSSQLVDRDVAEILAVGDNANEIARLENTLTAFEQSLAGIEEAKNRLRRVFVNLGAIGEDEFVAGRRDLEQQQIEVEAQIERTYSQLDHLLDENRRVHRIEEVADSGLRYLGMMNERPAEVRQWLTEHFRVTVNRITDNERAFLKDPLPRFEITYL